MRSRNELLENLRSGVVPQIVVIGGGINGVGTYRDISAQKIPVLLVEKGDFSSGTSAAPSRLIHGGLKYLETGEASLVRESLTERNLLLKNARHVVHPQPVWVPLFSWFSGSFGAILRVLGLTKMPGRKGAIPVKLGLKLYDIFGRSYQTMPDHRFMKANKAKLEVPVLTSQVRAVAEYYDARITHPERLVMELVADAESDCPKSMAIPYVRAGKTEDGKLYLHDEITGEEFSVAPKVVINASGAWVDEVQSGLGFNSNLIGGTKGSHLVIRNKKLADALDGKMLYFETEDYRICLIYPLEGDRLLLGTTDISTSDPDDKYCTDEEIDYLFDVLLKIVPDYPLSRKDIVYAFAGVRPLPKMDVGANAAISRDHRIDEFPPTPERPFHILALIGGKWTTYRAFAEQVTDRLLSLLEQPRKQSTTELAIGGTKDFPEDNDEQRRWVEGLAQETGLPLPRCELLARRYGSHAAAIARKEAEDTSKFETIEEYTPAEIEIICQTERVSSLGDIVMRRTLMAFEGLATTETISELCEFVAQVLDWKKEYAVKEVVDLSALMKERHRVQSADKT